MWHQAPTGKGNKKMKGLAITILLAVLELSAVSLSGGSLLTDGPAALEQPAPTSEII